MKFLEQFIQQAGFALQLVASWTPTELATFVGVVTAAVTGLLTWLSTKGVDAWLKLREDGRKDKLIVVTKEEEAQEALVETLKAQVDSILLDLKEVRKEHIVCLQNHSRLEGQVTSMAAELETLRKLLKEGHLAVMKGEFEHLKALEGEVSSMSAEILKLHKLLDNKEKPE